jgi:hypothetical protein
VSRVANPQQVCFRSTQGSTILLDIFHPSHNVTFRHFTLEVHNIKRTVSVSVFFNTQDAETLLVMLSALARAIPKVHKSLPYLYVIITGPIFEFSSSHSQQHLFICTITRMRITNNQILYLVSDCSRSIIPDSQRPFEPAHSTHTHLHSIQNLSSTNPHSIHSHNPYN